MIFPFCAGHLTQKQTIRWRSVFSSSLKALNNYFWPFSFPSPSPSFTVWSCCQRTFEKEEDFKQHFFHTNDHLTDFYDQLSHFSSSPLLPTPSPSSSSSPPSPSPSSVSSSFPSKPFSACKPISFPCSPRCLSAGRVLLFYIYSHIPSPRDVASDHFAICDAHHLSGKVRISEEGINSTVAGSIEDVERYKVVTQDYFKVPIHWKERYFHRMKIYGALRETHQRISQRILCSHGCVHVFDCLSVKVCAEIVPMGIPPSLLSPLDGAQVGCVLKSMLLILCVKEERGKRSCHF